MSIVVQNVGNLWVSLPVECVEVGFMGLWVSLPGESVEVGFMSLLVYDNKYDFAKGTLILSMLSIA